MTEQPWPRYRTLQLTRNGDTESKTEYNSILHRNCIYSRSLLVEEHAESNKVQDVDIHLKMKHIFIYNLKNIRRIDID